MDNSNRIDISEINDVDLLEGELDWLERQKSLNIYNISKIMYK